MSEICADAHDVWPLLLRTHAVVSEALETDLQQAHGLPLTWFDVLATLAQAPDGRLKMRELAASVLVSRSGSTRLVDKLEEAGLVERVVCTSDRRAIYATITDRGRAVLEESTPTLRASVERHFGRYITDGDATALTSVLTRVLDSAAPMGADRLAGGGLDAATV